MYLNQSNSWQRIFDRITIYTTKDIKQRNSVIIQQDNELLILDPANDQEFIDIINKLQKDTTRATIIYSHSHTNHLLGADSISFSSIYAHKGVAECKEFAESRLPKPTEVYTDSIKLFISDLEIELYNMPGHIDNLSIVYIPRYKLLFASDLLLENSIPFIQDGDLRDYEESLAKIMKMDYEHVIPGHGKPTSANIIEQRYIVYFKKIREAFLNSQNINEILRIPVREFQQYEYACMVPAFHTHNIQILWKNKDTRM